MEDRRSGLDGRQWERLRGKGKVGLKNRRNLEGKEEDEYLVERYNEYSSAV